MKNLEIGHNYGDIFGLNKEKGQQFIYNGGISWTAKEGERSMTMDSQDNTDKAMKTINEPVINMGKYF